MAVSFPAGAVSSVPSPSSYPSCGFYWSRSSTPSPSQQRANACLLRAWQEGRKARLVAAFTTVEGDPIASYFFVLGRLDVLVVLDTTRDRFGLRAWTRMRCVRVVESRIGVLRYDACRTVGRGKPLWLKPVKLPG